MNNELEYAKYLIDKIHAQTSYTLGKFVVQQIAVLVVEEQKEQKEKKSFYEKVKKEIFNIN